MMIFDQYNKACKRGEKQFAVLIDPDDAKLDHLEAMLRIANKGCVDMFLVGGSLLLDDKMDLVIKTLRESCDIPVVIFPGNAMQINENADAILLLSLISGRNPDLLIGQHVLSAPRLRKSGLEIISTGYMLIDGGRNNAVRYMSNTTPIPNNKPEIAVSTAMAGEMLGLKQIYMDAGSGADFPISEQIISSVKKAISIPLIVGGGINTAEKAYNAVKAGADIVVVGNAFEKDPNLVEEIYSSVKNASLDYHLNK